MEIIFYKIGYLAYGEIFREFLLFFLSCWKRTVPHLGQTHLRCLWKDLFSSFMEVLQRGHFMVSVGQFKKFGQEKFHASDKSRHARHDGVTESGTEKDHEEISTDFGGFTQNPLLFAAEIKIRQGGQETENDHNSGDIGHAVGIGQGDNGG